MTAMDGKRSESGPDFQANLKLTGILFKLIARMYSHCKSPPASDAAWRPCGKFTSMVRLAGSSFCGKASIAKSQFFEQEFLASQVAGLTMT
jgi:hypothetical protein